MSQSFLYKIRPAGLETTGEYPVGREGILRTLTYFDIFQYPLTCDEIRQFLGRRVPENIFLECLRQLLDEKRIFFFNGVYSIQNNPLLDHRRKQGNLRAERLLDRAVGVGRFLYQFPFVSAIGISGSLSKNYADEMSDFDFFIITKPNRLWIARTFMHLYKKLSYLRGRQHFFCMNYYIDEEALLISDQNIFTAIELKTLLPVAGEACMQRFFETNAWADEFFPVCQYRKQEKEDGGMNLLKRCLQWITGFDGINDRLQRLTEKRWKRKEQRGAKNGKGVLMGLVSGKHFAKADPGGFQEKVLEIYEEKLSQK